MQEPRISSNWLARFQTIEYLRAFLFGREGWSPLNALLIVSGAFGIFDRQTLLEVGGYREKTIGEDMELTVRLHRILKEKNAIIASVLYLTRCAGPKRLKISKPCAIKESAGNAAC